MAGTGHSLYADETVLKSLPSETFAPYGTTTKTSLCFFQKFRNDEDAKLDGEVAFFMLENVGYDPTGRELPGTELDVCIEYMTKNTRCEPEK